MKAKITKTLSLLIAVQFYTLIGFTQTPQGFNYQAVVRDGTGNPIANKTIGLRVSLLNASLAPYYSETQTPTSNDLGVVSIVIGAGTKEVGSSTFDNIPWINGDVLIKIEIDPAGGTNYVAMGNLTKLQSVPYALFAENTKEVVSLPSSTDDDPIFVVRNKAGQVVFAVYQTGVRVYVEDTGSKGAKGGFAVGGLSNQFKGDPTEYLRITSDSARIYTNEITAKGAKGGFAVGGLSNQSKTIVAKNLLFVNQDSTRFYIDDSTTPKGAKGGFAVGGLSNQSKGNSAEYLRITSDSARIYTNETTAKGAKGGFAVGGLSNQSKSIVAKNLMFVNHDSTRFYIDDSTTPKGAKGGFAVGGLSNQSKGKNANFFNVSIDSTGIIYPSKKRVMWYPLKNAFLVGQVLIENPDSVGLNSFATGFESKAKGNFSQAFGYQAISRGVYSTAIGYQAVASKINSFAFGYQAQASRAGSYAFGTGAQAKGINSFAFGSVGIDSLGNDLGYTNATGDYAFAFGLGSLASGKGSIAFGAKNIASGIYATAIGYMSTSGNWYSTAIGGHTTASGFYSVAMGFKTIASGMGSSAFGEKTIAAGSSSFAAGFNSNAQSNYSIALGNSSTASGNYSIAMGYSSTANGYYSLAIGKHVTTNGSNSIAGGNNSTAGGISSIALGDTASTSANYCVALGRSVKATSINSVAIGNSTTASGSNSTALGFSTSATGDFSLAAGYGCDSHPLRSVAFGSYNVIEGSPTSWTASDPIFVVGNGGSSTSRSNAVTVYKNGTMKLQSNFYPELASATLGTSGNKWNVVYATNGTIQTSDIRLKDKIENINYGLTELLKLKPVSFYWKNNKGGRNLGFIAQDVEPIMNEVVIEGDDSDRTLGMNYTSFIPVIVKGMQEQQQQIIAQKQQIEELMNTIRYYWNESKNWKN